MIASVFRPARPWLVAATVAATCLLGGCDSRQEDAVVHRLKQLFRSIQPAPLLLRSLKAGVSTEDDVRAQLGKPETERRNLDGSKRLEYPRGVVA